MKLRWFVFLVGAIGCITFVIAIASNSAKKHDFTGKCQLCHVEIPKSDASYEDMIFVTERIDDLCSNCHKMDKRSSHPTGITPSKQIPLEKYLDKEGRLTCVTCHEVHKEEGDLLRGHTQGRSFCFVCHNEELLGVNWRHNLVVTYAHTPGKLAQEQSAGPLDKASIECLGCHDGTISKMAQAEVKGGEFQHGIGLSHPIGIEYPKVSRKNDYIPLDALPEEIQLFDGKISCLSCHNPYTKEKYLLVMDNKRSRLCLACHRK